MAGTDIARPWRNRFRSIAWRHERSHMIFELRFDSGVARVSTYAIHDHLLRAVGKRGTLIERYRRDPHGVNWKAPEPWRRYDSSAESMKVVLECRERDLGIPKGRLTGRPPDYDAIYDLLSDVGRMIDNGPAMMGFKEHNEAVAAYLRRPQPYLGGMSLLDAMQRGGTLLRHAAKIVAAAQKAANPQKAT